MEAGALALRATRVARSKLLTAKRVTFVAVTAVGFVRLLAAFRLHGPVLMPDEYLYTAIARSVAHGSWPVVRGGRFDFLPVLAPVLMAPAWLIHDVAVAYRAVQTEGVLTMSAAAIPAFAISRRVGLSERSAAAAAILAVLGPDLAYSGSLLSEPLAYPLFLTTAVLALGALRAPTPRSEALFLLASLLLCLARLQFVFVPFVYVTVALLISRPLRLRDVVRAHRVVLAALGSVLAGVVVLGPGELLGRYGGLKTFHHGPEAIVGWTVANVVLLLVAAGWVTAPGAALGLARLLRAEERVARAFAAFTLITTAALIGEAGIFGAGLEQLEERYTFYAVPLLLIAFMVAVERGLAATRAHAMLAGTLAAGSLFVPLYDPLFSGGRDGSGALIVFAALEAHTHWAASLLVGGMLLLAASALLCVSRRGTGARVVVLAAGLPVLLSASLAFVLASDSRVSAQRRWHVPLGGENASFLAFAGSTNPSDVTTVLFWNPGIERVVVLGGPTADGFASVPARIAPGGRVQAADGRTISGDLVFQPRDATVDTRDAPVAVIGQLGVVRAVDRGRIDDLLVGWSRTTGRLAPSGEIVVPAARAGAVVRRRVLIRLGASATEVKGLVYRCAGGPKRTVGVPSVPRTVALIVSGVGTARCGFAFDGVFRWRNGHPQTVEAQVTLKPLRVTADR